MRDCLNWNDSLFFTGHVCKFNAAHLEDVAEIGLRSTNHST